MPSLIHSESWDGVSAQQPRAIGALVRQTHSSRRRARLAGLARSRRRTCSPRRASGIIRTGRQSGRRPTRRVATSRSSPASTRRHPSTTKPMDFSRVSGTTIDGGTSYYWAQLTPDRIGFANPAHVLLYGVVAGTQTQFATRPEPRHIDRPLVYALARLPGIDDRSHAHEGERRVLPHQLGHVASRPDDRNQPSRLLCDRERLRRLDDPVPQ